MTLSACFAIFTVLLCSVVCTSDLLEPISVATQPWRLVTTNQRPGTRDGIDAVPDRNLTETTTFGLSLLVEFSEPVFVFKQVMSGSEKLQLLNLGLLNDISNINTILQDSVAFECPSRHFTIRTEHRHIASHTPSVTGYVFYFSNEAFTAVGTHHPIALFPDIIQSDSRHLTFVLSFESTPTTLSSAVSVAVNDIFDSLKRCSLTFAPHAPTNENHFFMSDFSGQRIVSANFPISSYLPMQSLHMYHPLPATPSSPVTTEASGTGNKAGDNLRKHALVDSEFITFLEETVYLHLPHIFQNHDDISKLLTHLIQYDADMGEDGSKFASFVDVPVDANDELDSTHDGDLKGTWSVESSNSQSTIASLPRIRDNLTSRNPALDKAMEIGWRFSRNLAERELKGRLGDIPWNTLHPKEKSQLREGIFPNAAASSSLSLPVPVKHTSHHSIDKQTGYINNDILTLVELNEWLDSEHSHGIAAGFIMESIVQGVAPDAIKKGSEKLWNIFSEKLIPMSKDQLGGNTVGDATKHHMEDIWNKLIVNQVAMRAITQAALAIAAAICAILDAIKAMMAAIKAKSFSAAAADLGGIVPPILDMEEIAEMAGSEWPCAMPGTPNNCEAEVIDSSSEASPSSGADQFATSESTTNGAPDLSVTNDDPTAIASQVRSLVGLAPSDWLAAKGLAMKKIVELRTALSKEDPYDFTLTGNSVEDPDHSWYRFDVDADGSISVQEMEYELENTYTYIALTYAQRYLGVRQYYIKDLTAQKIVRHFDENGDSVISKSEMDGGNPKKIMLVFMQLVDRYQFDHPGVGGGYLKWESDEVDRVIATLPDLMFHAMDMDQDSMISAEEAEAYMTSLLLDHTVRSAITIDCVNEEVAATAQETFQTANSDPANDLSREEFTRHERDFIMDSVDLLRRCEGAWLFDHANAVRPATFDSLKVRQEQQSEFSFLQSRSHRRLAIVPPSLLSDEPVDNSIYRDFHYDFDDPAKVMSKADMWDRFDKDQNGYIDQQEIENDMRDCYRYIRITYPEAYFGLYNRYLYPETAEKMLLKFAAEPRKGISRAEYDRAPYNVIMSFMQYIDRYEYDFPNQSYDDDEREEVFEFIAGSQNLVFDRLDSDKSGSLNQIELTDFYPTGPFATATGQADKNPCLAESVLNVAVSGFQLADSNAAGDISKEEFGVNFGSLLDSAENMLSNCDALDPLVDTGSGSSGSQDDAGVCLPLCPPSIGGIDADAVVADDLDLAMAQAECGCSDIHARNAMDAAIIAMIAAGGAGIGAALASAAAYKVLTAPNQDQAVMFLQGCIIGRMIAEFAHGIAHQQCQVAEEECDAAELAAQGICGNQSDGLMSLAAAFAALAKKIAAPLLVGAAAAAKVAHDENQSNEKSSEGPESSDTSSDTSLLQTRAENAFSNQDEQNSFSVLGLSGWRKSHRDKMSIRHGVNKTFTSFEHFAHSSSLLQKMALKMKLKLDLSPYVNEAQKVMSDLKDFKEGKQTASSVFESAATARETFSDLEKAGSTNIGQNKTWLYQQIANEVGLANEHVPTVQHIASLLEEESGHSVLLKLKASVTGPKGGDGGTAMGVGLLSQGIAKDLLESAPFWVKQIAAQFSKGVSQYLHNGLVDNTEIKPTGGQKASERIAEMVENTASEALIQGGSTAVYAALERMLPLYLVAGISTVLTQTVTRSLTHSLSGTLQYTLTRTPMQEVYCYYCHQFGVNCEVCNQNDPSGTMNHMHNYYGQFFASYYSDFYCDQVVNTDYNDATPEGIPARKSPPPRDFPPSDASNIWK